MFWIKLIKMIFIILSFVVGGRAGYKMDEKFKSLRWYDKVMRIYWLTCVAAVLLVLFVELWIAL